MNLNNREVQIFTNGEWVITEMRDLKIDDVFRMFEFNGKPTHTGNIWIVYNLPIYTGTTWMVDCEEIECIIYTTEDK